jgi:hypothetical protein
VPPALLNSPASVLVCTVPRLILVRLIPVLVFGFLFLGRPRLIGLTRTPPPGAAKHDYYVSASGDDTKRGSRARPWRTIQHADKMVRPGDTVHVLPGTYSGVSSDSGYASYVTTTTSGTPDAWITYVSEPKWGARIVVQGNGEVCAQNPNAEACNGGTIWANTANYITIQGFEMVGAGTVSHGFVNYASNVRIVGNKIHDIPAPSKFGAGMNSTSCHLQSQVDGHGLPCGNVWAIGNMIFNIGTAAGTVYPTSGLVEGIYFSAPRENVVNNIVYNVSNGWCIDFNHYGDHAIITNNTLYNCGKFENGNYFGGGINISSEEDFAIVDHVTVANNIVSEIHGEAGIRERIAGAGRLGPHNFFSNNLFFKVASGQNSQICWSPPSAGGGRCTNTLPSGSIVADPKFVSAGHNFHVLPNSLIRGAGTTECATDVHDCAPKTDFDGRMRSLVPLLSNDTQLSDKSAGIKRASIGAFEP